MLIILLVKYIRGFSFCFKSSSQCPFMLFRAAEECNRICMQLNCSCNVIILLFSLVNIFLQLLETLFKKGGNTCKANMILKKKSIALYCLSLYCKLFSPCQDFVTARNAHYLWLWITRWRLLCNNDRRLHVITVSAFPICLLHLAQTCLQ